MQRNSSTEKASSPVRYTLPRTARVIRRKDFRRIYARGSRAGGKSLIVVALRRREDGHRVGLSVSKAHGCAVVRNKIKRIFREAFRLERPTLPGRYDVVLIPREGAGKLALPRVRQELRDLLQRIDAGKGRKRGDRRPQNSANSRKGGPGKASPGRGGGPMGGKKWRDANKGKTR